MCKVYQCTESHGPYGPRISIERNIAEPNVMQELKVLSVFGGPSGSNPKTHMWEFGFDGKNYAKAIVFLRCNGYQATRDPID